jgi:hypothetical protein
VSAAEARTLLSAAAVRERAHQVLDAALDGGLADWRVDLSRLEPAADLTAEVVHANYPDLQVPFHARWRHFVVDGRDLWLDRADKTDWASAADRARAEFDLAFVSVLLDAGAGPAWRYEDGETGVGLNRSEGLAVASLRLFEMGGFSTDPARPLQADGLAQVNAHLLGAAFQARPDNPLPGLDGRAALLRALSEAVGRPGLLFDEMVAHSEAGRLPAASILEVLLERLGPIWPGRLLLDGVSLGDCWRHPAVRRTDATDGYMPLHKLSQWLAYSLIEPLQTAGIEVVEIDGLTGLAEYRNGGLFLDMGVLNLADPSYGAGSYAVDSVLVVGWRAMTVALLDRLAPLVRERLGVSAGDFPLARVLEGGSWAAGRRIARELRAEGGPPLSIVSDGTVF